MPYVDLNTLHNPATGTVAPASWGDGVRDNFEFLIDPPACSVKASSAQSVTDSTLTVLNAATEIFDNNAMHSTVTNNSRITAQTAGRYQAHATVRFATDADGGRGLEFLINGATAFTMATGIGTTVTDIVLSGSRSFVLAVADYIEVRASHSAGNALNVTLEDFTVRFITR